MPELPLVGVTAIIAGMGAFNRDAAIFESRLVRMGAAAQNLERASGGAFGGTQSAFGGMAATVAAGATVVAGGLAFAAGAAVKMAADFQQSLALTQALTGANDQQIQQLGKSISDLSRTGTVSMSDLAGAATELVRSGTSIDQVMGGALKAVQDLTVASGGEIGLANSAKLVATGMQAFGISVADVDKITTAATVVAQNSALTFTDFGHAVAIAGAPFRSVGFSINDLAIAEAILGRNAMTGEQSSTALRNIIQRLEKPSKDAKKVMDEYGISLFDSSGKAVTFRELLSQLNNAFGDQAVASGKLTEQQRDQALATLFLQRAGAAALILTREGTAAYDELAGSFANLRAQDLVDVVLKPLNAQLEIGWHNVVALAIAFGAQFLPPLLAVTASTVTWLQSLSTDAVGNFSQKIVDIGIALVSGIGNSIHFLSDMIVQLGLTDAAGQFLKTTMLGLGAVILSVLVPPVLAAIGAFAEFLLIIGVAATAIEKLSVPVANIIDMVANWASSTGIAGRVIGDAMHGVADIVRSVGDVLRGDFESAAMHANVAFQEFGISIQKDGGAALDAIGQKLDETGAAWAPWAAQAGPAGALVSGVLVGVHQGVEALAFLLQGNFAAASGDAQKALQTFHDAFAPILDSINGAVKTAFTWLSETALPAIRDAAAVAGAKFDSDIKPALERTATFITETVLPALQRFDDKVNNEVIPAALKFANETMAAIIDGAGRAGTAIDGLKGKFGELNTKLGEKGAYTDFANGLGNIERAGQTLSAALGNVITIFGFLVAPIEAVAGAIGRLLGSFAAVLAPLGFLAVQEEAAGTSAEGASTKMSAWAQTFSNITAGLSFMADSFKAWTDKVIEGANTVAAIITFLGGSFSGFSATTAANTAEMEAVWAGFTAAVGATITAFAASVGATFDAMGTALSASAAAVLASMTETWNGVTAAITGALGAALAGVQAWAASVLGEIAGLAGSAGAQAAAIGEAVVSGLVGGITAGVARVAAAAANLVTSAINAARSAADAHSPSRKAEDLGEDISEGLTQGIEDEQPAAEEAGSVVGLEAVQAMIDAVERMKPPVRAAGASLVDTLIGSFTDIANRSGQLMADLEASVTAAGEKVGEKINQATIEAADNIKKTIADAKKRVDELTENLAQSRSDRSRTDALSADQDRRRADRKKQQEDDDAKAEHNKQLADEEVKHRDQVERIKAKFTQEAIGVTDKKKLDSLEKNRQDEIAAADLSYTQKLRDIDRDFAASEKKRLDDRARQQSDADFERGLAEETRKLNDQLEDEALQRSIDRANQDRDARIDAINQALTAKIQKIQDEAAKEIENLNANVKRRLAILEDEFAKKAADILRKGGENMRPLVENIQSILSSNFSAMSRGADSFARSVEAAIGALQRLEAARNRVQFKPPELPSPVQGLGDGTVDLPEDTGDLPEFGHGGVVPGPPGAPMLAIVHGGELVTAMDSMASRMARQMVQYTPPASKTYNYNVNASYANTQSPASIDLDMRALIAMSRG